MSLSLYQRLTYSEALLPVPLDALARNYRRVSRAVGGWYSGAFAVDVAQVSRQQLETFYNTWIGCVVKEHVAGILAWEGIVYAMQLTLDGAIYEISLDPERWHNNVDVYYSDLAVEDIDQGTLSYYLMDVEQGALSYTDEGGAATFTDAAQDFSAFAPTDGYALYRLDVTNSDGTLTWAYLGTTVANTEVRVFTDKATTTPGWNGQAPAGLTPTSYNVIAYGVFSDTGQDFSDWQTLAGDALYRIQVANSDNTTSWGYLGPVSVANERINVYTVPDWGASSRGWNGEEPAGKTPVAYEVINVANYGVRRDTGWSDNADSVDEHGEMEYIITLSGSQPTPATALRDRSLTEFAWPRSRFIGTTEGEDALTVTLAGFWGTAFWRYWEHSQTAAASTLVTNLATDAQFIAPGNIDVNALELTADAFPIPQRIGDLLMRVQEMGDASGNIWNCGVYEGRKLSYVAAPTTAEYVWRDGRLLNKAGQPVPPELVRPGFYLRARNILGAVQPPGTSDVRDDPNVAYVDEVEWSRDDGTLTLSLRASGPSIILRDQILRGAA
jgi:hypothetical protein